MSQIDFIHNEKVTKNFKGGINIFIIFQTIYWQNIKIWSFIAHKYI